jgi:hypothetical protein
MNRKRPQGESEFLNYELATKVFHVDLARVVGAINGSGFAAMVHEMPGM